MRRSSEFARAFTLIELLMVVVIISILAGIVLGTVNVLKRSTAKSKTNVILAEIRQGIELTVANKGGAPAPSEHPLAGSKAPRSPFVGLRGRILQPDGSVVGGAMTVVNPAGQALKGVDEWSVTSNGDRVMMPDDLFADPAVPILFGMRREYLYVIGADQSAVTDYFRLPKPAPPATTIPPPYDNSNPLYTEKLSHVISAGTPQDNQQAIDYLFGNSNVSTELARLKALFSPPDDAALIHAGLLWSPEPSGGESRWKPGRILDGGAYKLYRLRGLGLYDAWGHEILSSYSRGGALRLMSAGPDGVFRWDPGPDGILQTTADAVVPAGDDLDGSRDNIVHGDQ